MFQINNMNRFGWSGLLAAAVWATAAAGVVYWVLQLTAPVAVPIGGLASSQTAPAQTMSTMAKALGHAPTALPAQIQISTQYKLMGVIASTTGQGSALIAADGLPPKAFRVGQEVSEGVKLVSLAPKQARLKSNGQEMVLDLLTQANP